MSHKAHGEIRRSQVIRIWGPGALLDLPKHSVIVGGLEKWPTPDKLEEIHEPRLVAKIRSVTGIKAPKLYAPPIEKGDSDQASPGITVLRFPKWFLVQERGEISDRERSRRLVPRSQLDDRGRFERNEVVPTRFVRACPKGHIDDIDWYAFVHPQHTDCRRPLWLDEKGTSGDLFDLAVRCECGLRRGLHEAAEIENRPLGFCSGERPWIGRHASEGCRQPSRLLIRTASNAYFPQVMSVLSLPNRSGGLQKVVAELWDRLEYVDSAADLDSVKKNPRVMAKLSRFSNDEILDAIEQLKKGEADDRPVKAVELDAILAAPEGFGGDIPIDPDFHVRRLPERIWKKSHVDRRIGGVIQLHRLREVLALTGFSRFEPISPNIHGEYPEDLTLASLAQEPSWFPAIENRGEGVFIQLHTQAVESWLARPAVQERLDHLRSGHEKWKRDHNKSKREFPGGAYILLHTLSHLLIQSLAVRCGYPASSITERIYVDPNGKRYGLLLCTGSSDAEGTLGGLVQEARHIEAHLAQALRAAALCSNDPICAQHNPAESLAGRWLLGAACHGCVLVAETSCEMRNDYLDRALVVPTLDMEGTAFFEVEE